MHIKKTNTKFNIFCLPFRYVDPSHLIEFLGLDAAQQQVFDSKYVNIELQCTIETMMNHGFPCYYMLSN